MRSRFDWSTRLATRRFSRRAALGSIGGGVVGVAAGGVSARGSMTITATPAPEATPAASAAAAGLAHLAFQDPEFDGQFLRALDTIPYRGADTGECFVTARRIPAGDRGAWYDEWFASGDRVYALAQESRATGHTVSARDAYLRAVTCYRTAFDWKTDTFAQAGALFPHPAEAVKIPYEHTTLPPTCSGRTEAPRPGRRSSSRTATTGPCRSSTSPVPPRRSNGATPASSSMGQGEVLLTQHLYFRPDWEAVITPVVDYALTRPEIDAKRIALMGRSRGGYLAPRAATAEHRIAALIADAAQYDPAGRVRKVLPPEVVAEIDTADPATVNAAIEAVARQVPQIAYAVRRGMLTHGVPTPLAWVKTILDGYTITGRAERITCPTLICEGEQDVRGGDARPLYDAITAPRDYVQFKTADGAGEHDEAGAATHFSQVVFDWLDEVFAGL